MFKIGDFSQIAQVSVRMLRHYDKLGLLKPEEVDSWTGYRYYRLDQLSRMHRILALRDLGLSLEQVGALLDDPQADDRLDEMLRAKQQAIEQQLAEEQARLDRVAARLRQLENVHAPIACDVVLKGLPAQRIAAVREVVPEIPQMGVVRDRMLRQLYDALATARVEPGRELAIYHLQAYTEQDIDMSLAVELSADAPFLPAGGRVKSCHLPAANLAASIVYRGDMWNIPDVVASLYLWLGMNGYTSAGAYREIHLFGRELDLFATDPPGEGVIDIVLPIEKI